jgi:hypothetical protein
MPADVVVCVLQDEGLEGGTLRNFGLKVGMVGTVRFEARIQELVATIPDLAVLVEPLLVVRRALREQMSSCTGRLLAIVRNDEVCQRLMTMRSTQQWKDVPRGTMDEVSSHVRLNLSFKLTTRPRIRLFYLALESP